MNFTVGSFRRYALYSTYVMLTRLDTLVHVTCVASASLKDMIYYRSVGSSKNLEGGGGHCVEMWVSADISLVATEKYFFVVL